MTVTTMRTETSPKGTPAPTAAAEDLPRARAARGVLVRQAVALAGLMILAAVVGIAWLAIPAALATVALAAGAVLLELRARRDADVILHSAPFSSRAGDSDTTAVLQRRAAALTAQQHRRALAAAVRGYGHARHTLLVAQPHA